MSDPAALKFAYDHLGQYLHDGPYDPGKIRHALTRKHPQSAKNGEIRLGSVGDTLHMALISKSQTFLKADIRPSKPLPEQVAIQPASWRTNPAWRAAIMVSPPLEPYMVIVFDKSTDYLDTLRLSSQDMLFECGPHPRLYNLAHIRRGLATFDAADPEVLFEAKRLIDLRLRHFAGRAGSARFADDRLGILQEETPNLFELCDEFPDFNTIEYDALRMICRVDAKARKAGGKTQGLAA